MRWRLVCLLLTASCGASDGPMAASGPCGDEARQDVYVANLAKDGVMGAVRATLVEATPGPPDVGDNAWTVRLEDATSNQPLMGQSGIARPWMPDHGHGSPDHALVETTTPGTYEIGPMKFFMPGFWTVTLRLDSEIDEVRFGFCVEG